MPFKCNSFLYTVCSNPQNFGMEPGSAYEWHFISLIAKYISKICEIYRRDGVVVRASASQSVDLGFIPLVESYQKTLKNGIYSFPAWRSAFMGGCGEQAGKFACCVLGQGT